MDETGFIEHTEEYIEDIANLKIGPVTLGTLVSAVFAFLVCFVIIHIITAIIHRAFHKEKKMGSTLHGFFESAIRISLWIIAAIIIAEILGIPTTSLVAAVGVVGLALSLSVQSTISNLFSGITILVTKPFEAGDYVEIDGNTGTIKRVGLFYTIIVTLDNVRVSIPNGDVTSTAVQNFSGEGMRRVEQKFCASYDSPTDAVRAAILEAARGDEKILSDPAPAVFVNDYKDSSIEYTSRVWCAPKDYWHVLHGMNERVRESFAAHGVVMTYNHLNVHIDK